MSRNRRAATVDTINSKVSLKEVLEIGYHRKHGGAQNIGVAWSPIIARNHNHQTVENALEAFARMLHAKTAEGPLPEGDFKFVYKASFLSIMRKGRVFDYGVQVMYHNSDPFWPDAVRTFNVHLVHPNGELVNQVQLTGETLFRLGPVGNRKPVEGLYQEIVVPNYPPRKWSQILEEE